MTLEHGDPRAIYAMLQWIYTGDYKSHMVRGIQAGRDMVVFIVSKTYDLPDLSRLAMEKFATNAKSEWSDWGFADFVKELFSSPMDDSLKELRAAVLKVCADNATKIFTTEEEDDTEQTETLWWIRAVLDSNVRFAAALAAELAKRLQLAKE